MISLRSRAAVLMVLFISAAFPTRLQCSSPAETAKCSIDVPVNVVLRDGRPVRSIPREDFSAQTKGGPVSFEFLDADNSPRRVLLIAQISDPMTADGLRIQKAIFTDILSRARPKDLFALLVVGSSNEEFRFGTPREKLLDAVARIPAKRTSSGMPMLDAIATGIDWFDKPQQGDSIITLLMGIEGHHKANFSKVQSNLDEKRIRLSGFLLGTPIAGFYDGRGGPIDYNYEGINGLSWTSGGSLFTENTTGEWHTYKLTDERLGTLKDLGWFMYSAATQFYKLRLSQPPGEWKVTMSQRVKDKISDVIVVYPRRIQNCTAPAR